jgi:hypothetical protein
MLLEPVTVQRIAHSQRPVGSGDSDVLHNSRKREAVIRRPVPVRLPKDLCCSYVFWSFLPLVSFCYVLRVRNESLLERAVSGADSHLMLTCPSGVVPRIKQHKVGARLRRGFLSADSIPHLFHRGLAPRRSRPKWVSHECLETVSMCDEAEQYPA